MGILSALTGTDWNTLGGHQIDPQKVLAPTDPRVPRPRNPGKFSSVRSTPILEEARYFDSEETKALQTLAKDRKAKSKSTQAAMAALKDIDDADTQVHQLFYQYRQHLASNEVKKLSANTKYAKALHDLRPKYAALGSGLQQAELKATAKIQAIKGKLREQFAA